MPGEIVPPRTSRYEPLTEKEAAALLRISERQLQRRRLAGRLPTGLVIAALLPSVRYSLIALQRLIDGELHAAADDLVERERAG